MNFEKVIQTKFKKKSSFIADQILRMINSGGYTAGSKLPSERIITEQMGVSRPSLREAISALQIVGILESRPGDGTYVCFPSATEDLKDPRGGGDRLPRRHGRGAGAGLKRDTVQIFRSNA
ncbi:MAG: GntR family transcriptional regulator [Proteobacteria bacterium]|nr:GntR family transcriptional regulator [Pseudomonadota bacterium]MBU1964974.1 GntR family transcriptional regulator [Pseudomonadota bacterium]MBU4371596.1 GntR family transcriptional regulator [Pseudomonadota bacterium]MBU4582929.1 GntR family transcriptional regulator [Pseudomonadota bacterium]MCG2741557.1 GntR family transcriptional regulator [Syntrophaceae bacterium]